MSWSVRRQPIVLTQREKDRIDKKHPGSYNQAIKYGTDPNKQMWYICLAIGHYLIIPV